MTPNDSSQKLMMPTTDSHLPLRRLLFRPWRWPRWLLAVIVLSLPIVYFLSAVPVIRMAEEHGRPLWMARWLDQFYFPVGQAAESVPFLAAIAEWESGWMDWIYGPPGITTDRIEDALPAFDRVE